MQLLEVIQRGTEFLARKGVESPRLQIELLLAHVLRIPRLNLYLQFDRPLSDAELSAVRQLVRRRAGREPLQHLVGSTSFCGLEIRTGPGALIPRPETESLVEEAWNQLERMGAGRGTILDFGTGTGCIALALASRFPESRIHAVEIDADAVRIALRNIELQSRSHQIQVHHGDGFAALPAGLAFDLIVSNPPYIPSRDIPGLQPEVSQHDPVLALDGGRDGLDFYRRLAAQSGAVLHPSGKLLVELGDGQAVTAGQIFVEHNWIVESVRPDYDGRPRVMILHR